MRACTPDLTSIDLFDVVRNTKKLELLLNNGCSIQDVDAQGSNCLHVFFSHDSIPLSWQNWKDSLIYLIKQGADPHALDHHGRSVFHIAYSQTCLGRIQERYGRTFGTYRGDLLDVVLHSCGENIAEIRREFPRKRYYGTQYSRQDFEQLWEGQHYPLADWDDVDPVIYGQNCGNVDQGNYSVFICTCEENPCAGEDYSNNDNDDNDDDDVDSFNDDNSEGGDQVLKIIDDEEIVEGDSSKDYATQPLDSQGPHRPNNNTSMADVHNYSSMDQSLQGEFSTEPGFLAQTNLTERMSEQNQEQEFYELPSSVWNLADQYDMDWTSVFVNVSDH